MNLTFKAMLQVQYFHYLLITKALVVSHETYGSAHVYGARFCASCQAQCSHFLMNQKVQVGITEARVHAEWALATEMQHHASSIGLAEWAGQIVSAVQSDESSVSVWFGGIELSPEVNSSAPAHVDIQLLSTGVELLEVCHVAGSCITCSYFNILRDNISIHVACSHCVSVDHVGMVCAGDCSTAPHCHSARSANC